MTDPKTPGPGDDGTNAARPGLRDKAQDVLARGSGDGRAGDAPSAPSGNDADSTRTNLPRQGASSVDDKTVTMSPLKGVRPEQRKPATPPPAAPAAPDRPLFADAQRPKVKGAGAPATSKTAVTPAVAPASPGASAAPAAATGSAAAAAGTPGGAAGAAPARKTQPAAKPRPGAPRKARLRLIKVDPWSVMKTAFLLSLAFGVVLFVAVTMVWLVLGAAGVWDSVNEAVKNFDENTTFDITHYLGTGRVLGLTALVAVVDVVLMTALATLTAFLYNMAASLLGGIELTFAEEKH